MISDGQLDELFKRVISELNLDSSDDKDNNSKSKCTKRPISLTAAQIMVISGILTDVLSVRSFLVDRDQNISITLNGSLKRKKKTELEKTLDEIGARPFDEVLKALIGRL